MTHARHRPLHTAPLYSFFIMQVSAFCEGSLNFLFLFWYCNSYKHSSSKYALFHFTRFLSYLLSIKNCTITPLCKLTILFFNQALEVWWIKTPVTSNHSVTWNFKQQTFSCLKKIGSHSGNVFSNINRDYIKKIKNPQYCQVVWQQTHPIHCDVTNPRDNKTGKPEALQSVRANLEQWYWRSRVKQWKSGVFICLSTQRGVSGIQSSMVQSSAHFLNPWNWYRWCRIFLHTNSELAQVSGRAS